MIAARQNKARRETVALTRRQVESIMHGMGWEPEDATAFWRLARREKRDPGCLARERGKKLARLM